MTKRIFAALAATVSLLAVLELIGWLLTAAPPALDTADGRTKFFSDTFYVVDPDLIVKLRAGLRADFNALRPGTDIPVQINSAGFRGAEFDPPDPDAYRILVFGDSVTFGLSLAQADAWPTVMAERLADEIAPHRLQVRNLAVPGYSSFQGRQLFERHALQGDFEPQLVIFGFGFNDGFLRSASDPDVQVVYRAQHSGFAGQVRSLLQRSYFLALLLSRTEPPCTQARVPPPLLEEALATVAAGCQRIGAELILADTCLPYGYARAAVDRVAQRAGVTALHFRDVFATAVSLPPATPWPAAGRLRLEVETYRAPIPPSPDHRPAFYALALPDPSARNDGARLALNDLGVDGDLVASDGIWSCVTPEWPAGAMPEVAFNIPGTANQPDLADSDALMLNSLHFNDLSWVPPTGAEPGAHRVLFPNQPPWRDLVLTPDPIHPNEAGALLLGEAVAAAVRALAGFRTFH